MLDTLCDILTPAFKVDLAWSLTYVMKGIIIQWQSAKNVARKQRLDITAAFPSEQQTACFTPICSG
jgi:hypothetical protein